VRPTKAVFLLALSVTSLAFAAAALAGRTPAADGMLSVREGRATIQLRMKGSVIGRLARGHLTVTHAPDHGSTIVVRGADRTRDVNARTTIYSGKHIRFRVADDRRFVVKLGGKGLNFSAVGRGDGWMDGWGDPESGVFFDGSYSLNGTDYPTLPNERQPFDLSVPSGG
jgi:hypothetical protein